MPSSAQMASTYHNGTSSKEASGSSSSSNSGSSGSSSYTVSTANANTNTNINTFNLLWDPKGMPPPYKRHSSTLRPHSPQHHRQQQKSARPGSSANTSSPSSPFSYPLSSVSSPTSSHLQASPSPGTTLDGESPPYSGRQRVDSDALSTSSSTVQMLAEAMADLPNLSEVKTACDSYLDECGPHGASLTLCYVDPSQMEELWLNACSMQLSRLQLAFLYVVLACTGASTPAGHPHYGLETVTSSTAQEEYMQIAVRLLANYDADLTKKSWEEVAKLSPSGSHFRRPGKGFPFPTAILRCQLLTMLSKQYVTCAQYENSWHYAQQSVLAAHASHLFDTARWSNNAQISPSQLHTIKILQMEMCHNYNWGAYTCEHQLGLPPFDPKLPDASQFQLHPEDPFEQAIIRQKIHFSYLARKIASASSQDMMSVEADPRKWLRVALQLDDELMSLIASEIPRLREVPGFALIDANDRASIRVATLIVLIRGGWMMIRWRMMQIFFEQCPFDVFQHTAICSARMTLQMLPLIKECFTSPWQSTTNRAWIDGTFNQALFIFLMAIKAHLYQSPPPRSASDSHDYSEPIRAELVWFMTNFNRIYNAMNRLGMVRTALTQCAAALQRTPVRVNSNTEYPIFELHDEASGPREAALQQHDESSKNFQQEYRNCSGFKAAHESHSPKGQRRPSSSSSSTAPSTSSRGR